MKLVTTSIVAGIVASILSIITLLVLTLDTDSKIDNHKLEQQVIGQMVQHLDVAINSPTDKDALQTIVKFGTDSRYYLMIRGWLVQKLNGIESRLQAQQSQAKKSVLAAEVDALKEAIRAIDLE